MCNNLIIVFFRILPLCMHIRKTASLHFLRYLINCALGHIRAVVYTRRITKFEWHQRGRETDRWIDKGSCYAMQTY